jgi:hypothetical protein
LSSHDAQNTVATALSQLEHCCVTLRDGAGESRPPRGDGNGDCEEDEDVGDGDASEVEFDMSDTARRCVPMRAVMPAPVARGVTIEVTAVEGRGEMSDDDDVGDAATAGAGVVATAADAAFIVVADAPGVATAPSGWRRCDIILRGLCIPTLHPVQRLISHSSH